MGAINVRMRLATVVVGGALGLLYTLSPLTVLMLPAIAALTYVAGRNLPTGERRLFFGLLLVAVVARVAAVAALFLSADHELRPFATFFGDEEMFKFRSIWLRNIGLGLSISSADFIYAVEETGKSQYLFLLAYLEALVGDAPYGIHLFNLTLYLAAVQVLYRSVRDSFGRLAALGGLVILLFLPSLFIWSISALKEPLYTLLAVLELWCVLQIARSRTWGARALALVSVITLGLMLEGLRKGGLLVAGIGLVGGLSAAFMVQRRTLLRIAVVATPVLVALAVTQPFVHDRVLSILRDSAIYHVGHVFTPGYSYRTLDFWYYIDPADIRRMPLVDAIAYVGRSLLAFVVQPLPWTIESRAVLAYLPEHAIWLCLVALLPIGAWAGMRRDPTLTCVLVAHGIAIVLMVALTSGNVGTLIRHRGLALPYFVWLSALGATEVIRRVSARASRSVSPHVAYAVR